MSPEPQRALLVAASYVVLRRRDEILLQLRRGTGYMDEHWALMAGHVEPDESAVEAAAREVKEEAGVDVALTDLDPLTTLHRYEVGGPAREQRCDFFFEAWRWSGEPALLEANRTAEMRWFSLDALPTPVVPHELLVIDDLRRGLRPPAVRVVRS